MGYLKYLKQAFQQPSAEQTQRDKERLVQLRKEPNTVRIERPTRIDRARALGYKAKDGVIMVRQCVGRGRHTRADIKGGRTPRKSHKRKNLSKNYQQIAEEKAGRSYLNCEVLGSYLVAQDGKHSWFEIILVDRAHPQVLHDPALIGIAAQRGRAQRGLTSAARKARGLGNKGVGAEKLRPSKGANLGRH